MRRWHSNAIALLAFTALSFAYFGLRVVTHPGRDLIGFGRDSQIFVWSIAWWPHAIGAGDNPFLTDAIWAPDGFNLAWATTVPGLALALSPLTLLAGPVVAYNVAAVLMPALAAWTAFLLCRHLTNEVWASLVGGYVFGFSAYMLGQQLGHLHASSVFLLPLIALAVVRFVHGELSRRSLTWRLTVLLALQLTLSTEVFFTAALALVVGAAICFATMPELRLRLRALLRPLLAAYALAALATAPLLYYALRDFESVSVNRPDDFSADLLNLVVPTRLIASAAGWAPSIAERFPGNDAERGAYLGLPLLLLVGWFAVQHRHRPAARFLVWSFATAVAVSLGTALHVAGRNVVPLPWELVARLPAFNNVLPVRIALFASLAGAVIVASFLARTRSRAAPVVLPALLVLALVPRLDIPVWTTAADRPAFFADDLYRVCLGADENVFPIPYGSTGDSMLWQAESDFRFRLTTGYIRPVPPFSFVRFPAGWLIHFNHVVPPADDFRKLVEAKGVDRIVVRDSAHEEWLPVLAQFGPPTRLGGVVLYPGCSSSLALYETSGKVRVNPAPRVSSSARASSTNVRDG